jgi:NitT/TauT family transport system substrate-binding protein
MVLSRMDEGYFDDEKLEVEFIKTRGGTPKNGLADTSLVNPIVGHAPFVQGEVKLFRACEEGNVHRAARCTRWSPLPARRSTILPSSTARAWR